MDVKIKLNSSSFIIFHNDDYDCDGSTEGLVPKDEVDFLLLGAVDSKKDTAISFSFLCF